nr:tetratricopeptide repeat protein [Pirellulaceae bacterium]
TVALFPDSWNAWDSLGEVAAKAGLKEKAVASYRRSLELNPQNKLEGDARLRRACPVVAYRVAEGWRQAASRK